MPAADPVMTLSVAITDLQGSLKACVDAFQQVTRVDRATELPGGQDTGKLAALVAENSQQAARIRELEAQVQALQQSGGGSGDEFADMRARPGCSSAATAKPLMTPPQILGGKQQPQQRQQRGPAGRIATRVSTSPRSPAPPLPSSPVLHRAPVATRPVPSERPTDDTAATTIAAHVRGHLTRRELEAELQNELASLEQGQAEDGVSKERMDQIAHQQQAVEHMLESHGQADASGSDL